ncbi:MAG: amidohydrolase family protein [Phycisphaerae bacterium]
MILATSVYAQDATEGDQHAATPADRAEKILVIQAKTLWTGSGAPIADGIVVVRGGKIVAAGADVEIPESAEVRKISDAYVTPGLIDANCVLDFEIPEVGYRQDFSTCHDPRHARGGTAANCLCCAGKDDPFWSQLAAHAAREASVMRLHAMNPEMDHDHGPGCICGVPFSQPMKFAGLSESASGVSARQTWADQSSEVIPHLRVADSLNLLSRDFDRLARSGVTCVYVAPDTASVIGARGAIVKTGGPVHLRMVESTGAVQAALGSDPSNRGRSNMLPPFYGPPPTNLTRRPTTRMGVDFVFRKAFHDARRAQRGLGITGADAPPAAAFDTLNGILDGDVPLRIHARLKHDILYALELSRDLGLHPTLVEVIEAWDCIPQLLQAKTPIVYGPVYMDASGWRASSGESADPRLTAAALFAKQGVSFALTANDMRDEDGLARQAMIATRYGLSQDDALRAITETPAELLGIADRCGSLAPGKDADLVVWNGSPCGATSRPVLVMINGQVVYEGK